MSASLFPQLLVIGFLLIYVIISENKMNIDVSFMRRGSQNRVRILKAEMFLAGYNVNVTKLKKGGNICTEY